MSNHSTFETCDTKEQAQTLLKDLNAEPREIIGQNKKAYSERCREIRKAELVPFHEDARSWRQGQKVFFGKPDNRLYMSFDTMKTHTIYNIKAGQWCRVWEYQPRNKLLWLCRPGKKCEWKNVIDHGFTLGDIQAAEISRTEIAIRSK